MQVNKAFLTKQNEAHPDSHKIFNRRLTCHPELNRDYQIWIKKVDKPPWRILMEKNYEAATKPIARHFNLPCDSLKNMVFCGLSLRQGNKEIVSLKPKFIFETNTLLPI